MVLENKGCRCHKCREGGEKNIKRKDVIVAVIDTGVDYTHEILENHMWNNVGEIADDGIDNDKNGFIDDIVGWNFVEDTNDVLSGDVYYENDHGTECASIISSGNEKSEFRGISYDETVKIMTLKVLRGIEKEGKVEDVIEAIKYAESNGADICNLSINFFEQNEELSKLIKKSNMLFVVSAGNGEKNIDKEKVYFASYNFENIIAVAATDQQNKLYIESNYGKKSVDIAAPGENIYCAVVDGYDYDTGTSMATAVVSGISAMIMSYSQIDNASELKNLLMNSASKKNSLSNKISCGGIINAKNAISMSQDVKK